MSRCGAWSSTPATETPSATPCASPPESPAEAARAGTRRVQRSAYDGQGPGDRPGPDSCARRPEGRRSDYLRFLISSVSCGATWNRSPTTPLSTSSKIGASESLLMATIVLEVCMPARCWFVLVLLFVLLCC